MSIEEPGSFSFAPGHFGPLPDELRITEELSAADAYPTSEAMDQSEIDPGHVQTYIPETE